MKQKNLLYCALLSISTIVMPACNIFLAKNKIKNEVKGDENLPNLLVNIELVGGGYYGGIDPVVLDYIHIKPNGRLIKEFRTQGQGLLKMKKNLSAQELQELAAFIEKQGFFKLKDDYNCEDYACQQRKRMNPRPISLRLSVTYGERKKMVSVAIWGRDDRNMQYVNYPSALDKIIFAIQRTANETITP